MSNTAMAQTETDIANAISPIEDIIEDARNGKMIILVDAEDRENEGDLVIPAQLATPDVINFMATNGRGLVCMPITAKRAEELQLRPMSMDNQSRNYTAFTTSIEAREGITTGISAHDRAHTISVAIDPTRPHTDIVTPGHVFPLIAKEGGVLVRAGHTEAAVDIARLAGMNPAGVIVEIMNDDGTMARLPDLVPYAKKHDLKIGTIADLIAYRRKFDNLISLAHEGDFSSEFGGDFKMKVFSNTVDPVEHIALIKGDISGDEPVAVRMHALDVMKDVLTTGKDGKTTVQKSMELIEKEGRGVIVLFRETEPTAISAMFGKTDKKKSDPETPQLVEYGIGAQILLELGITKMELLSNSPKPNIVGLEGYGLEFVGQKKIG